MKRIAVQIVFMEGEQWTGEPFSFLKGHEGRSPSVQPTFSRVSEPCTPRGARANTHLVPALRRQRQPTATQPHSPGGPGGLGADSGQMRSSEPRAQRGGGLTAVGEAGDCPQGQGLEAEMPLPGGPFPRQPLVWHCYPHFLCGHRSTERPSGFLGALLEPGLQLSAFSAEFGSQATTPSGLAIGDVYLPWRWAGG